MALEGIQENTRGAYQYRTRAVLISTEGICGIDKHLGYIPCIPSKAMG